MKTKKPKTADEFVDEMKKPYLAVIGEVDTLAKSVAKAIARQIEAENPVEQLRHDATDVYYRMKWLGGTVAVMATGTKDLSEIHVFVHDYTRMENSLLTALHLFYPTLGHMQVAEKFIIDMAVCGLINHCAKMMDIYQSLERQADAKDLPIPKPKNRQTAASIIRDTANNPTFRNYLADTPEWDDVPRVETLFIDYLGLPDTPLNRKKAKLLCAAAVLRTKYPGTRWGYVPVIEGKQGCGKSSFIGTLFGRDHFAELHGLGTDKDYVTQIAGEACIELPELGNFNERNLKQVEDFITSDHDKVRLPYDTTYSILAKTCVFIGTTNDSDRYLKDMTQPNLFWPMLVQVDQIDIKELAKFRDQIWAEAQALVEDLIDEAGSDYDVDLTLGEEDNE